jgi:hypothetical protein
VVEIEVASKEATVVEIEVASKEATVEEIEVDSREATAGQNVILTKKISHFSEKGNYFYINF